MSFVPSSWRPRASMEEIKRRAEILHCIRTYFHQQQVMEVETPMLSTAATVDPYIDSFHTDFALNSNHPERFYLHTSPEFPMKRLLSAGSGDIYCLGKVFRNEEMGERHNPEFTLLEWYRLNLDHHSLMDDVSRLLSSVCNYKEYDRCSYQALFDHYIGINPHQITLSELIALVGKKINISINALTRNDCLDLLFTHIIEPDLKGSSTEKLQGIFVYDYPAGMSGLSQLTVDSAGQSVAARFELFISGMEIANGYHELTDGVEQKNRFKKDQQIRESMKLPLYPFDQHMVDALEAGLPNCAGVALGIDRLHMLIAGVEKITDVLAFDFSRA